MRLVEGRAGGGSPAACPSLARLRLQEGTKKLSQSRWVVLCCPRSCSRGAVTFLLHGVVGYDLTFRFVMKAFCWFFYFIFKASRCYCFMVMWIKCLVFVKLQVRTEGFLAGCSPHLIHQLIIPECG